MHIGAPCLYFWGCRTALTFLWYLAFEFSTLLQHPFYRLLAGFTLMASCCYAVDRFVRQN